MSYVEWDQMVEKVARGEGMTVAEASAVLAELGMFPVFSSQARNCRSCLGDDDRPGSQNAFYSEREKSS